MSVDVEALAELCWETGVRDMFGVAGSGTSLSLIDAFEKRGGTFHCASHEAAGAIMAGAVVRSSGRLSASISIKGPGLANMIPGISVNHFENIPALSISEQYGSDVPFYRKHKRLDHRGMLASVAKGTIGTKDLRNEFDPLMKRATAECPGPVHVELCNGECNPSRISVVKSESLAQQSVPFEQALSMVEKSNRPLIIAGSLAARRDWRQVLTQPCIPTFTTVAAKGVVDEYSNCSAGVFTGNGKKHSPETSLFDNCDLVIGLGLRNTEVLAAKPFGKATLIIDEVDCGLVGGFDSNGFAITTNANQMEDLLGLVESKAWGVEAVARARKILHDNCASKKWSPVASFDVLNRLSWDYGIVVDTGLFSTIAEHFWLAKPSRAFWGSSNGRYMGTSVPTAIGVSFARPKIPIICVSGDGGFRMYVSEIRTAIEQSLPICFVLMTDGGYGSIAGACKDYGADGAAVSVPGASWHKGLQGLGCDSLLIASRQEFEQALGLWRRDRPLFLELPFERDRYRTMTDGLR